MGDLLLIVSGSKHHLVIFNVWLTRGRVSATELPMHINDPFRLAGDPFHGKLFSMVNPRSAVNPVSMVNPASVAMRWEAIVLVVKVTEAVMVVKGTERPFVRTKGVTRVVRAVAVRYNPILPTRELVRTVSTDRTSPTV